MARPTAAALRDHKGHRQPPAEPRAPPRGGPRMSPRLAEADGRRGRDGGVWTVSTSQAGKDTAWHQPIAAASVWLPHPPAKPEPGNSATGLGSRAECCGDSKQTGTRRGSWCCSPGTRRGQPPSEVLAGHPDTAASLGTSPCCLSVLGKAVLTHRDVWGGPVLGSFPNLGSLHTRQDRPSSCGNAPAPPASCSL